MIWIAKHLQARYYMLGYIPDMLSEKDPRPAAAQFGTNYVGGWRPFPGFRMLADGSLLYPGDPPLPCLFESRLRNEVIRFYEPGSWVAVIQADGKFEVSRLD